MSAVDAGHRVGFLANVIERAHEHASVVAPRPVSLFEPIAVPLHMAPTEVDDAYAPASDSVRDDPPATIRQRVGMHEATPHTGAQRTVPRMSERPDEKPAAPIARGLPAPAADSLHDRAREFARQSESPAERIVVRSPLLVPNVPVPPVRAGESTSTALRHDGTREPDVRARFRLDDDIESSTADARDPAPARVASLLPNREAVVALASRDIDGRDSPRQGMQQAASSSVVTISIGRVEVRAAPAPTAARAKATRQPTRLDEYLDRKERAR